MQAVSKKSLFTVRCVLPGVLNGFLMVAIHLLGTMRFAVSKVQANLPIHVIIRNGALPMRNAIQRAGLGMAVDRYQAGPSAPKILFVDLISRINAVDLAQHFRISS